MARKSRAWFYGPRPFTGTRNNTLPWVGSDEWGRYTLVLPALGLGALVIGLWRIPGQPDCVGCGEAGQAGIDGLWTCWACTEFSEEEL